MPYLDAKASQAFLTVRPVTPAAWIRITMSSVLFYVKGTVFQFIQFYKTCL